MVRRFTNYPLQSRWTATFLKNSQTTTLKASGGDNTTDREKSHTDGVTETEQS